MKKVVVLLLLVGLGVFLAKKTHVGQMISLLWCNAEEEIDNRISTKDQIKLIRREIDKMQSDVRNMLNPIAEEIAKKEKLEKDIETADLNLQRQQADILKMTQDLKSGTEFITYGEKKYTSQRIRQKLDADFASYKMAEKQLQSWKKSLEAADKTLGALREQVARLHEKKREYETELAQLEADEATLQVAHIGSNLHVDSNRASKIHALLAKIKHRHAVERAKIGLANGEFANDFINVHQPPAAPKTELNEIENYFKSSASNGSSSGKVTASK